MVKSVVVSIFILISVSSLLSCSESSSGSNAGGKGATIADVPQILSVHPEANASAVRADATIATTFDKIMNTGTTASLVVYGSQTGKLAGSFSGGGTATLGFDSFSRFKAGEEIDVILTGFLTSTEGGSLAPPLVYRFRTETVSGPGGFSVTQKISGQSGAGALAAGDWDSDGDIDLAVANYTANRLALLKNDGTGNFTVGYTFTGLWGPYGLAAGDWDGDGDLDLVVANLDGDWVVILANDGTGNFEVQKLVWDQIGPATFANGDWDGDGDLDIIAANFIGDWVDVLKNTGGGNFTLTQRISARLGTLAVVDGDWDGDGDIDLALANSYNSTVDVVENDGTGRFSVSQTLPDQSGAMALAEGDWNGDGDIDLAVANAYFGANRLDILENDGAGGFAVVQQISDQPGAVSLAAGDWDGDGDIDLAVANRGDGSVVVLTYQP